MLADLPDTLEAPAFDALLGEALSLIPAYAPAWTNHNPSDPGVTLVELLAYYTEILAWRALRITPDAKLLFLRLLDGGANEDRERLRGLPAAAVDDALRERISDLSRAHCAVTRDDFERLAAEEAQAYLVHTGKGQAVRTCCLAGVDSSGEYASAAAAAHGQSAEAAADMSVVLTPEQDLGDDDMNSLCEHVQRALALRCLLTTRVHVVAPSYLRVSVGCRLALHAGAVLHDTLEAIDKALRLRFGPVAADEAPTGSRMLGRSLQLSEVAEVIDRSSGVDFVEAIAVQRIEARRRFDDDADWGIGIRIGSVSRPGVDARLGGLVSLRMRRITLDDIGEAEAIALNPWEAVRVQLDRDAVVLITEAAAYGDRYGR